MYFFGTLWEGTIQASPLRLSLAFAAISIAFCSRGSIVLAFRRAIGSQRVRLFGLPMNIKILLLRTSEEIPEISLDMKRLRDHYSAAFFSACAPHFYVAF